MRMNTIESGPTELIGINPNFQIEWIRSIQINPNLQSKWIRSIRNILCEFRVATFLIFN